jgi:hypothetical protein
VGHAESPVVVGEVAMGQLPQMVLGYSCALEAVLGNMRKASIGRLPAAPGLALRALLLCISVMSGVHLCVADNCTGVTFRQPAVWAVGANSPVLELSSTADAPLLKRADFDKTMDHSQFRQGDRPRTECEQADCGAAFAALCGLGQSCCSDDSCGLGTVCSAENVCYGT